jgi:predicted ATP-binding protein involved in virulence
LPDKGFIFKTTDGKTELKLSELSSGEQHQIILLYELIFNLAPDTLVLIDEPEISLHVAWQELFISDLLKIMQLQKTQAIVATHSPQIIDVHSELKYDLYKSQKELVRI